ncbi:MAG TPA: hypothetical protein VIY08_12760 [Candidatus Nitrosocosmicus sp.]
MNQYREILSSFISTERNIFLFERSLSTVIEKFGNCIVSSVGDTWYP